MKILFLTFGPPVIASSRTRVYQYIPFLRDDGIIFKIIPAFTGIPYRLRGSVSSGAGTSVILQRAKRFLLELNILFWNIFNVFFSIFQIARAVFVSVVFSYDIVFVQKVFMPLLALRILKFSGVKLVFDFDDAIYTQKGIFRNQTRFDKMILLYDLVVLENEETGNYVRGKGVDNILTITGPIDVNRYRGQKRPDKNVIVAGWIGSPSSSKYLYMIKSSLARLCNKYPELYFETIGAGDLELEGVRLIQKRWAMESEVRELQDFDIGIMPLADDPFSRGKGGYKLLQYMSMGIPCCSSPVGINSILVEEGMNGLLACNEDQWFEKLSNLVENASLRKMLGDNGRDLAEKVYSFEAAYPRLKQCLGALCQSERQPQSLSCESK